MLTNQFSESTAGGATAVAFSVQDLASDTDNPDLFLEKYNFYVEELGFTPQQAIRWAHRTVRVDTQVKRAFRLKDE